MPKFTLSKMRDLQACLLVGISQIKKCIHRLNWAVGRFEAHCKLPRVLPGIHRSPRSHWILREFVNLNRKHETSFFFLLTLLKYCIFPITNVTISHRNISDTSDFAANKYPLLFFIDYNRFRCFKILFILLIISKLW